MENYLEMALFNQGAKNPKKQKSFSWDELSKSPNKQYNLDS